MLHPVDNGLGVTEADSSRGNMTQASSGVDVTAYSGDALDRLNDVNLPDGTALAYTYDADGRRVRQVVGGAETNYLWDENSLYGDVVLETDAGGAPLASYVLGGPELLSQTRAGATSYYLADAQGSTRALANSSGAITDTYDYTAYGGLLATAGTTTNSYLCTGQQFDTLTGLYSLRARYYEPALGRFSSRDPMEVQVFNPVEMNRYVYAAGNPVNLVDPSGRGFVDTGALYISTIEQRAVVAGIIGLTFLYALTRVPEIVGVPEWTWPDIPDFSPDGPDPNKKPEPPRLSDVYKAIFTLIVVSLLSNAISGGPQPIIEGEPQPVGPPEPTRAPSPPPDLIYRSGSRIKDLSLHRVRDWETGLSFSGFPPGGRFLQFRTNVLTANGYAVRADAGLLVTKLWTGEVVLDPSTGAQAVYPPGHVTVYHPDRNYWDEWHYADLANLNSPQVSAQLLAIYSLREP